MKTEQMIEQLMTWESLANTDEMKGFTNSLKTRLTEQQTLLDEMIAALRKAMQFVHNREIENLFGEVDAKYNAMKGTRDE